MDLEPGVGRGLALLSIRQLRVRDADDLQLVGGRLGVRLGRRRGLEDDVAPAVFADRSLWWSLW